jgi:hypothetical protein
MCLSGAHAAREPRYHGSHPALLPPKRGTDAAHWPQITRRTLHVSPALKISARFVLTIAAMKSAHKRKGRRSKPAQKRVLSYHSDVGTALIIAREPRKTKKGKQ